MKSRTTPAIKPRRAREPGEFANFTPSARSPARMTTAKDMSVPAHAPVLKTPERKSQAIRDSANGQDCLMLLPGCIGAAGTIWSHNRHWFAGKGRGIKAIDVNGAYACTHCDALYDRQAKRPPGLSDETVELAWYHAHTRSLVLLKQKGLL